uniref:Leucine-rich repeat-containing N-terminal plant-type domain-containing protein n=1 Tax=Ananas comosus var. bracteatus TaxID=296719 RepID=A0A6V7P2C2_ANACO|nr:unnamed protein product [Ananas comosus var. bracteatus]
MPITLLIVIISMMMFSGIFAGVGCPAEEYEALLELKASCNGTSPPSWGKHRDCCLWERVVCDNSTEQVTELHLSELFWSYQPEGNWNLYEDQSWQLNLSIFSSFVSYDTLICQIMRLRPPSQAPPVSHLLLLGSFT